VFCQQLIKSWVDDSIVQISDRLQGKASTDLTPASTISELLNREEEEEKKQVSG